MTSVSIALASFNGEAFIQEQLASFVDQDRMPDELVVTDDCSTDATVAIVQRFAETAPFRVRIERNAQRLGYNENFARAIVLTTGDIIMISDQDDRWFKEKISTIIEVMNESLSPIATVNDQRMVDSCGNDLGMTMFGNFRRARCPDTDLIAGSCTAFPRQLLPLFLPFPCGVPYDSWIGAVADSLGIKRLIEQPLQTYRRHQSNATQPIVATRAPSQWSAFARYGLSDAKPGWLVEIAWRSELVSRLIAQRKALAPLVGKPGLDLALATNQQRITALRQRYAVLQLPRWRRLPAVLRHWNSGFYEQHFGARSAIKDILRP